VLRVLRSQSFISKRLAGFSGVKRKKGSRLRKFKGRKNRWHHIKTESRKMQDLAPNCSKSKKPDTLKKNYATVEI